MQESNPRGARPRPLSDRLARTYVVSVNSLPTYDATRYVQPLREGGSLPAIVDTDDGLYVVKFRGAGQGAKALVAELIVGLIARAIFGGTPVTARIGLHGSFAATGEGHGTHRAIVGGLVGIAPDDLRLRRAYDEAKAAGLDWTFEDLDLGERLAQLLGGSLTVRSESGSGSTFTLRLPERMPARAR